MKWKCFHIEIRKQCVEILNPRLFLNRLILKTNSLQQVFNKTVIKVIFWKNDKCLCVSTIEMLSWNTMNMSNAAGILTATALREECTVRQLTACTVTNKSKTRTSARTRTPWTARRVTTCHDQASPTTCTLSTQLASLETPSPQVCPLLNPSILTFTCAFILFQMLNIFVSVGMFQTFEQSSLTLLI